MKTEHGVLRTTSNVLLRREGEVGNNVRILLFGFVRGIGGIGGCKHDDHQPKSHKERTASACSYLHLWLSCLLLLLWLEVIAIVFLKNSTNGPLVAKPLFSSLFFLFLSTLFVVDCAYPDNAQWSRRFRCVFSPFYEQRRSEARIFCGGSFYRP